MMAAADETGQVIELGAHERVTVDEPLNAIFGDV